MGRIVKFLTKLYGILVISLPVAALGQGVAFDPVVVTAPKYENRTADSDLGASHMDQTDLESRRSLTSDSAELLRDVPGVSISGAGGVSGLPAIHGLADDRVRIEVDGMNLKPACPNHMNPALSYINPTKVTRITTFAGITPVSLGGDSLGGTIRMTSATPAFAQTGQKVLLKGEAGSFYRSNGNAYGYNFAASAATGWASLSYTESNSQSDSYKAARAFKPVSQGREDGPSIRGRIVASSEYHGATNRDVEIALQHDGHLLQVNLGQQRIGFEGFPNQRMDMTHNDNKLVNARYQGQYWWGDLESQFYYQHTRHEMDMGPDRYFYGTGMPMNSKADTYAARVQGNILLSARDTFRVGADYTHYTLYDWWPAVGGSMGPNTFWNIDYGQRNKAGAFAEWEADWTPQWVSLLGLRSDTVHTDAGPVQGYDNGLAGQWGNDAAAFNALDHARTDSNWDLTALVRYTPSDTQTYEAGYARKSRSPNLYQRYPWSTNPMAALMNNLVGDGNGYIGNVALDREAAHTVSVSGDWHGRDHERWGLKTTGYYTHVNDYIDARRCDFGQCSPTNTTTTQGFVFLQYTNHRAQLYGADVAGHLLLIDTEVYGNLTATGLLNYVRGKNLTTGDNLHGIMPFNVKFNLTHRLGTWTNTAEAQWVAAQHQVSRVRNAVQTGDYPLFHLRTGYVWKFLRVDAGIENLLDRFYAMPLGGAYLGQGPSMTTNGIPWGVTVPGPGRSFHVALNLSY